MRETVLDDRAAKVVELTWGGWIAIVTQRWDRKKGRWAQATVKTTAMKIHGRPVWNNGRDEDPAELMAVVKSALSQAEHWNTGRTP